MKIKRRTIVVAAIVITLVGAALIYKRYHVPDWGGAEPKSAYFANADARLIDEYNRQTGAAERSKLLFGYFLAGYLEYKTPDGERIFRQGFHGVRGRTVEGLEGFARTAPLFATWIRSGRSSTVPDPRGNGRSVDLVALLENAILRGTEVGHEAYWGDFKGYDKRVVEASDVALMVWMTRTQIWDRFDPAERAQVAAWLQKAAKAKVSPNNWLLFRSLITEVLVSLDVDVDAAAGHAAYQMMKSDYLESGWFFDKPKGVDFYNAWAITYSLFWIDQINPTFDHGFISSVQRDSGELTSHLVGPEGIPMMGRSACYRMAVPSPLITASITDPAAMPPGEARRALDMVWTYFVRRGGLADGAVTQGYFKPDIRFNDDYTGPSSCMWAVRSLVLALGQPEESPFWKAPEKPLPIEVRDYHLVYPKLGWVVDGDRETGEIRVTIPKNPGGDSQVEQYTWPRKAVGAVLGAPFQPENYGLKYKQRVYSNIKPVYIHD